MPASPSAVNLGRHARVAAWNVKEVAEGGGWMDVANAFKRHDLIFLRRGTHPNRSELEKWNTLTCAAGGGHVRAASVRKYGAASQWLGEERIAVCYLKTHTFRTSTCKETWAWQPC